jgi:c(7)-type cytochrome triheme protein
MKTRVLAAIAALGLMFSAGMTSALVTGGGDMKFAPPNAKPVVFSHEEHVSVKELRCSACHNHTFQMGKGEDKMDMSKMTKSLFCGRCHNGVKGFSVKDKANCARCHK